MLDYNELLIKITEEMLGKFQRAEKNTKLTDFFDLEDSRTVDKIIQGILDETKENHINDLEEVSKSLNISREDLWEMLCIDIEEGSPDVRLTIAKKNYLEGEYLN